MSSGHRRSMVMDGYDADKMLDVYIYDLLKKRNFEESAKAFLKESNLPAESANVAIDVPDGFLLEWWTVFWDVFMVRSGQPHSGIAASYVESQQATHREQHQQQQQQRLRMQGKLQGMPDTRLNSNLALKNVLANPRMSLETRSPSDHFPRQPTILSRRLLAAKQSMLQRETTATPSISDPSLPIVPVDGVGESSTSNPAPNPANSNFSSLATIPTVGDQQMPIHLGSPGLITQGGDVSQLRQQLHLKGSQGWPLTAGGLRQQIMSSQVSEHFGQSSAHLPQAQRVLSAQMQQQMLLRLQNQAGSQRMSMGSGQNSTVLLTNVGTGVEFSEGAVSSPSVSQGSHDNREKYMIMSQAPQQQLQQSNVVIPQHHQRQQLPQQDTLSGVGGTSLYGRKRKEKYDSSRHSANSLGAMNTSENFSSSPNSDPTLQMTSSSKAEQQLQSQIPISMASANTIYEAAIGSGVLDDGIAADVDLQVASNLPLLQERVSMTSKTLVGDIGSADSIPAEAKSAQMFSFGEVSCLRASTSKVLCCHFSSNGKLLASAGHDKKVNLWNMTTLKLEQTLEEHSLLITDVRFSPTSTHLATSSLDKTVKVWEIGNPTCSIRTFQGHATSVWALDFHPNNEDLLCSCDGDSEIRYWSVSQGSCIKSFKGGVTQLRFQSRIGRFLAAAAENVVSIFNVESETSVYCLLDNSKPVTNLCWSASGDFLVSLTEDYVRVWSIGTSNVEGGERYKCIYELGCKEKMFRSCVFHPNYPSLLVIGCYQSMELWNMVENKIMTVAAHDGLIVSLVACPSTGLVASASHDKCVKLWQ